jgi:hypothetical protein
MNLKVPFIPLNNLLCQPILEINELLARTNLYLVYVCVFYERFKLCLEHEMPI